MPILEACLTMRYNVHGVVDPNPHLVPWTCLYCVIEHKMLCLFVSPQDSKIFEKGAQYLALKL